MKQMSSDSRVGYLLSVVIAVIFVLLPFHALFTTWIGSNLGHLDVVRVWKEIILVISLPLAVVLTWRSPKLRKWLRQSWIVRLFGLYILLHIILGIWAMADDRVNSTALLYSYIVNLRFITFFIVCAIATASSQLLIRNWDKIILLPASLILVFGIVQRFFLPSDFLKHFGYGEDTIPAYQTVDAKLDYQRVQSTLRGANPLGAYLILIITTLAIILRKNRTFMIGALIASLMLMFYSYSRSAWIGLGLALATLLLLERPKLLDRYTFFVILSGLVITVAGIYLMRSSDPVQDILFHTSEKSQSAQSSNQQRFDAMRAGVSDIINQPQGGGPGTAGPASFRNSAPPKIAENYYLQIGQEIGLIGVTIFATINILVGVELWRRKEQQLARILLASLVGITFVNLVSHAWTDDTLAYLWWGLAGIACAPAILSGRSKAYGKKQKLPET